MNLPAGANRVLAKSTVLFNVKHELMDLSHSNFSGYVIETLLGSKGVDESAVIFRSGLIVGMVFEYHSLNKTLLGDSSIPHVANGFAAKHGVIDIVELSTQQVDLITAFNPAVKLSSPLKDNQLSVLVQSDFDSALYQKVSGQGLDKEVSRSSLFRKFGLAGLGGS